MQFIKTLLWVVLAVMLALFTYSNWQPVTVYVGGGVDLDTKLPVLVIGAFLAGFVPMWLLHRTVKWRLKRRVTTLESANNRPAPSAPVAVTTEKAVPSQSTPLTSE